MHARDCTANEYFSPKCKLLAGKRLAESITTAFPPKFSAASFDGNWRFRGVAARLPQGALRLVPRVTGCVVLLVIFWSTWH
jgi:hypothetical protein